MNNEKYNGWTNYQTWKINLELLDGLNAKDLFGGKCEGDVVYDYVSELLNEQCRPGSIVGDLAHLVLDSVNWDEIAEHLNED